MGDEQLKTSPAQDLGVLVTERLDMTQPWVMFGSQPRDPNVSWAASKAEWQQGEEGDFAPLLHSGETQPGVLHSPPGSPR